jgi:uncharacterized protein (DUF3820 family)
MPSMDDQTLPFGKHKGRTYADIYENEPRYVAWCVKQEETRGAMKAFQEYCQGKGEEIY